MFSRNMFLFLMVSYNSIAAENLERKTRSCNRYNDILPNGFCSDVLGKYTVYQSLEEVIVADKLLAGLYSVVSDWRGGISYTNGSNQYDSLIFSSDKCSKIHKKITEKKGQMLLNLLNCFHQSKSTKWLLCHTLHPVCLQSSINSSMILSPPCKSSCQNGNCFYNYSMLYSALNDWRSICLSAISNITKFEDLFSCEGFPTQNIHYIEGCQRRFNANVTVRNCHDENGSPFYLGRTRLTRTGKFCMYWRETSPFLSPEVYPTLVDNYCRNPQGYSSKPWCYTDSKYRNWDYCAIKKCSNKTLPDLYFRRKSRPCIKYKDALPHGICKRFLENQSINNYAHHARKRESAIERLSGAFKLFQRSEIKERLQMYKRLLRLFFRTCTNTGLNQLLSNAAQHYKLFAGFLSNFQQPVLTWTLCVIVHRPCLKIAKHSMMISPPCQESCLKHEEMFKSLYNFLQHFQRFCPVRLEFLSMLTNNSICSTLPTKNMKHIEKCQMFDQYPHNYTQKCYYGNGRTYIGKINTTASGKICQPWKLNPYLATEAYPILQENFCRNPQGYLSKPWCYVTRNLTNWEFCDIQDCSVHAFKAKQSKAILILVPLLSCIAIAIFLSTLLYRKHHTKRDAETDAGYLEAYAVCDTNDKEMINLLRVSTNCPSKS